jgi:hypothetical protein
MPFKENPSSFLFGQTKKPEIIIKKNPDYSVLSKPFEWKESIAFCFCLNCGLPLEINKKLVEKYIGELKIEMPKSTPDNQFYFELDNCNFCSEDEKGIKLKNVEKIQQ